MGGMRSSLMQVPYYQMDEYDIHPRIDKLRCWKFPAKSKVKTFLPDLTTKGWDYAGDVTLNGIKAHIWWEDVDGDRIWKCVEHYTG